jgi:hypothetical protein
VVVAGTVMSGKKFYFDTKVFFKNKKLMLALFGVV